MLFVFMCHFLIHASSSNSIVGGWPCLGVSMFSHWVCCCSFLVTPHHVFTSGGFSVGSRLHSVLHLSLAISLFCVLVLEWYRGRSRACLANASCFVATCQNNSMRFLWSSLAHCICIKCFCLIWRFVVFLLFYWVVTFHDVVPHVHALSDSLLRFHGSNQSGA